MYSLGMDLGTSTVKIVLMQNGTVEKYWLAVHHGRPLLCLRQGLSELAIGRDETLAVCVTGDNAGALLERCPVLSELGEILRLQGKVRKPHCRPRRGNGAVGGRPANDGYAD